MLLIDEKKLSQFQLLRTVVLLECFAVKLFKTFSLSLTNGTKFLVWWFNDRKFLVKLQCAQKRSSWLIYRKLCSISCLIVRFVILNMKIQILIYSTWNERMIKDKSICPQVKMHFRSSSDELLFDRNIKWTLLFSIFVRISTNEKHLFVCSNRFNPCLTISLWWTMINPVTKYDFVLFFRKRTTIEFRLFLMLFEWNGKGCFSQTCIKTEA